MRWLRSCTSREAELALRALLTFFCLYVCLYRMFFPNLLYAGTGTVVTNMERLFTDCRQVLRRRQANGDEEQEEDGLCDSIITQLESSVLLVEEGIQMLQASPQYSTETQVLFSMRRNAIQYMREILYGHDDCTVPPVAIQPFKTYIRTGNAGRPQVLVNLEQVELLRGVDILGLKWQTA